MKTGLILMTALPPTKGHQYLVDFAIEHLAAVDPDNILKVIINGRNCEPISVGRRQRAFFTDGINKSNVWVYAANDDMPQEPSDHPQFWEIWKTFCDRFGKFDYVYASETYGAKLAEVLGAEFVPCNLYRDVVFANATRVRNDPLAFFTDIHPGFQDNARATITIFGPESCGKTTMAAALAQTLPGHFVPEWARGYLENFGAEVTSKKMEMITEAQYASQKAVEKFKDKPFIIRDTDLLSTYGYYALWGDKKVPKKCQLLTKESLADYYILMNDQIPFEADPLRYGGDKRESDNSYWKNLLDKFELPYYCVQSYSRKAQLAECQKACRNFFYHKNNWKFER